MQKIRSLSPPVVIGICDPKKSQFETWLKVEVSQDYKILLESPIRNGSLLFTIINLIFLDSTKLCSDKNHNIFQMTRFNHTMIILSMQLI